MGEASQVALITAIASVVVAVIGLVASILTNVRVNELKDRIDELEDSLCSWKSYVGYLRTGIRKLIQQILDIGHEPVWRPEKDPPNDDE